MDWPRSVRTVSPGNVRALAQKRGEYAKDNHRSADHHPKLFQLTGKVLRENGRTVACACSSSCTGDPTSLGTFSACGSSISVRGVFGRIVVFPQIAFAWEEIIVLWILVLGDRSHEHVWTMFASALQSVLCSGGLTITTRHWRLSDPIQICD